MFSGVVVTKANSDATLVKVILDTDGKTYSEYNSALSQYLSVSYMTKEAYADDANAFQIKSTRPEKTMRFTISPVKADETSPTAGVYVISGKMLGNKANADGKIDFSTAYIQLNRTSSGNTAAATLSGLSANTWLDFTYIVDIDNGEFTVKYRNPADEEGVYEYESTDSFAAGTAFGSLYIQLLYSDTASAVAFKDIKFVATAGDAGLASIVSVNDGTEVTARQKNLSFTLSDNIPGLEASHITVTSASDGVIDASSINVTENGDEYEVRATFAQRFTENTTYTLAIDPAVYADYKLQWADGTITDVEADGLTMDFVTGDYTIDPTGTGELIRTLYDTEGKAFSGYGTRLSTSHWPKYIDGEAAVTLGSVEINNTVHSNIDGAIAIERLDRSGAKDMYINFSNPLGSTVKGKYTISGKFFTNKAKDDGTADLSDTTIGINRASGSYPAKHNVTGLLANNWYSFKYEVDTTVSPNTFKVTYTKDGDTEPTYETTKTYSTDTYSSIRLDVDLSDSYTAFDNNGNYILYKDFKMTCTANKATILSVNSDASVAPNQSELTFTLSNPVAGLGENPSWIYAEDANGVENVATALVIDGNNVTATFAEPFAAWSDYTLYLSTEAYVGYAEYNVSGDLLDPVTDIGMSKVFSVASTGFDMRTKSVTEISNGVTYEFEYTNTSESCEPMVFVKTRFDKDGRNVSVKTEKITNLPVNGATETTTQSLVAPEGGYAKLFSVNGIDGLVPQFGRAWTYNYTAKEAVSFVGSDGITLGDFDYENKKISFGMVSGADKSVQGALYVYSAPDAMVYADYITTATDGTFYAELLFDENIDNETATYKVEFYSPELSEVLSAEFTCYDKEDRDQQKRDGIFAQVKASTNVATLIQAIKGTDSNDEVVNDNFDVFSDDANMTYYNKLKNKNAVFSIMYSSISSADDYDDIVNAFESASKKQYDKENPKSSGGGGGGGGGYVASDNKNYGSSTTVISESVKTPVESADSSVASSPFADMSGHWAEKFAAELSARGIMSGYPDGSFKGEASITRAELAKTIMEAIEIKSAAGKTFTDVSSASWYAEYVSAAAGAGIINGYEDGSFGPDMAVNRQDAVLMLYRALGKVIDLPTGYTFFKDDLTIDDYASDAVRCLGELGIVNGDADTRFNPKNSITRAEVTAIICRALDYIESH